MIMENRKTTSIKINPEIWNNFKIYCIGKKKDMSDVLEEMINKILKREAKNESTKESMEKS
jgi:hypothetical protein